MEDLTNLDAAFLFLTKTSLPSVPFVPSPIDSLHLHLSPAVDSSSIANDALILLSVTLAREA